MSKNYNRQEQTELLPGMSLKDYSQIIVETLSSEEFDARGEKNGWPLFERYEDRRRPKTDVQGIIPLVTSLLNQRFGYSIRVDREHRYPSSNYRCDFVLKHESGKELWVELKQLWTKPCTPYETAFTDEELISDIEKFDELSQEKSKAILQLAFMATSDFPKSEASIVDSVLKNSPFVWNMFDMPTKDNGPCTCHILLWSVDNLNMKK